MSQSYVPNYTWALCSSGKKPAKINVKSQSTISVSGQLGATYEDRFDGNFTCIQMMTAGALAGAALGAALTLTGGVGLMRGLAVMSLGAGMGANIGKLMSKIPSICSLLTFASPWSQIHEKTKFEKKPALLEKATVNCLLGGLVSLKILTNASLQKAIDMAMLANHIYGEGSPLPDGYEEYPTDELPEGLKDIDGEPWVNDESGFRAKLYKGPNREAILVFEGTDPTSMIDWKNNLQQGLGMESQQYNDADNLVKKLKKKDVQINTVAGHSLGGGLSTVAGSKLEVETYTYNAAGVHEDTFNRYKIDPRKASTIQAYSSDDDILTAISDNRETVTGIIGGIVPVLNLFGIQQSLPRNQGQRMELATNVPWLPNPAEGHNPKYIAEALSDKLNSIGNPVNAQQK